MATFHVDWSDCCIFHAERVVPVSRRLSKISYKGSCIAVAASLSRAEYRLLQLTGSCLFFVTFLKFVNYILRFNKMSSISLVPLVVSRLMSGPGICNKDTDNKLI